MSPMMAQQQQVSAQRTTCQAQQPADHHLADH